MNKCPGVFKGGAFLPDMQGAWQVCQCDTCSHTLYYYWPAAWVSVAITNTPTVHQAHIATDKEVTHECVTD